VDRGDEATLASVYHPDGTDDHGTFSGPGHRFAAWAVGGAAKVWHSSHHTVHNVMIEWRTADVAHVESYVLGFNRRRGEPGSVEVFAGRYLDRFERRDGEWKIAHRKAIRDVDTLLDRRAWAGKIPEGGRLPDDWLYRPDAAGIGDGATDRSG
jgi:hypothetical protein